MASTVRLYVDASYAIAIMALVGIVAGSATAGITNNTERSLQVAVIMFVLTGAFLTYRLWRITRRTGQPPVEAATPEG